MELQWVSQVNGEQQKGKRIGSEEETLAQRAADTKREYEMFGFIDALGVCICAP